MEWWNLPQHSYEELREVVVEVLANSHSNGVNQFTNLLENTARVLSQRNGAPPLQGGSTYAGEASRMHQHDETLVLEIVWDLFRQGIITLGLNSANPGWPWLKLSRFGEQTVRANVSNRFHDTTSYMRLVRSQAPDLSAEAAIYLEEAVAAFYAECLLASTVMLGVAAEAEFLRMVSVALANTTHGAAFKPVEKEPFVKGKIVKFQTVMKQVSLTLQPKKDFENLDTNLSMIQAVLRVARNDAGHPSGNPAPSREQVYVNLQLFGTLARQLMNLRTALA